MSKRKTLPASILSVFVLAALFLFAVVITARIKFPANTTKPDSIAALEMRNFEIAPQKGAQGTAGSVKPIEGVDVIVQKNPGNTAVRTATTNDKGEVTLDGLPPGNYSITIKPAIQALSQQPLPSSRAAATPSLAVQEIDAEALRQSRLDEAYYVVEISGPGVVGGTQRMAWEVQKQKFVSPLSNTAKATAPVYSEKFEFKVGGGAPTPVFATIIKSKSNISNN